MAGDKNILQWLEPALSNQRASTSFPPSLTSFPIVNWPSDLRQALYFRIMHIL